MINGLSAVQRGRGTVRGMDEPSEIAEPVAKRRGVTVLCAGATAVSVVSVVASVVLFSTGTCPNGATRLGAGPITGVVALGTTLLFFGVSLLRALRSAGNTAVSKKWNPLISRRAAIILFIGSLILACFVVPGAVELLRSPTSGCVFL
jgi:hypothetical protein